VDNAAQGLEIRYESVSDRIWGKAKCIIWHLHMDEQKIKEMAKELSKEIKSESDLADITSIFLKTTIESALGAE